MQMFEDGLFIFNLMDLNQLLIAGQLQRIYERRSWVIPHLCTCDFTTDFTLCESQNLDIELHRVRCESWYAKLSCKHAPKLASISWKVFWNAIMCICYWWSYQNWPYPTLCNVCKLIRRTASRWYSLSSASATEAGGFGYADISQSPLEMWLTTSSRSIWNCIPLNDATGFNRYSLTWVSWWSFVRYGSDLVRYVYGVQ